MNLDRIKEYIICETESFCYEGLKEYVLKARDNDGLSSWDCAFVACEAVGADAQKALPVAAANFCMLGAIHLVDDILDDDSYGYYVKHGVGPAANLALSMQSAGFKLLVVPGLPGNIRDALLNEVSDMMLHTSVAQIADAKGVLTEEDYWTSIAIKTPPLFSSALFGGALAGGADIDTARHVARLGITIGKMIQIGDDLSDVFKGEDISPDWRHASSSLPVLFGLLNDYPEKGRFVYLLQNIKQQGYLKEAREILISTGAFSYCIYHFVAAFEEMKKEIGNIGLPNKQVLQKIPDLLIAPVKKLAHDLALPGLF